MSDFNYVDRIIKLGGLVSARRQMSRGLGNANSAADVFPGNVVANNVGIL